MDVSELATAALPGLPGVRSRAAKLPDVLEVLRPLTTDDLDEILGLAPGWAGARTKTLRAIHHQIAVMLVQGREVTEVALATGLAISTISNYKRDPAFLELMTFYATSQQEAHVDSVARLKSLGDGALEELGRRLESGAETMSSRELMEIAKLTHIEPMKIAAQKAASSNAVAPPAAVTFNVNLVESPNARLAGAPITLDLPSHPEDFE